MNLAGRVFLDIKDAAIGFWRVLNNANGETRADILCIFGTRNRIATILAHGLEPRQGHGPEFWLVQDSGVGLGNWLARVRRRPVIGILCGAKERTVRTAIRI